MSIFTRSTALTRLLLLLALVGMLSSLGAKAPVESIVLQAVDDTYLVTDVSTTDDPQGLRDQNFGSLDFVRLWYKNKVTAEEQIVSIGLVKFDLAPLKGLQVESANLEMFALRADLTEPARLVEVTLVNPVPWAETDVTFNKRPPWGSTAASIVAVFGNGRWYSWDVSGTVASAKEPTVSYVLGLRTIDEKKEEQVVFVSREAAGRLGPRLVVTYATQPFTLSWYIWVGIAAGAAALAFLGGWWLPKRLRRARDL